MEVANKGITVNCVAPGVAESGWLAPPVPGDHWDGAADTSVARLGSPLRVAQLVVFLAQPASGHINGQVYGIEGGPGATFSRLTAQGRRNGVHGDELL